MTWCVDFLGPRAAVMTIGASDRTTTEAGAAIWHQDAAELQARVQVADLYELNDAMRTAMTYAVSLARSPDPDPGAIRRMRAVIGILLAADAPIPQPLFSVDREAARSAPYAARLRDIAPPLAVVAWAWCFAAGDVPGRPEVARYAASTPLGLEDPATRAWAGMEAARMIEANWSMTLLAACGAAA